MSQAELPPPTTNTRLPLSCGPTLEGRRIDVNNNEARPAKVWTTTYLSGVLVVLGVDGFSGEGGHSLVGGHALGPMVPGTAGRNGIRNSLLFMYS